MVVGPDLVDELRLLVLPTILASGRKLFGQTGPSVTLQLDLWLPGEDGSAGATRRSPGG